MSEFRTYYLPPEVAREAILKGFLLPSNPDDDQVEEAQNGAMINVPLDQIPHFEKRARDLGLSLYLPERN